MVDLEGRQYRYTIIHFTGVDVDHAHGPLIVIAVSPLLKAASAME
ncbi:hypothetical protein [Escherichia coli]